MFTEITGLARVEANYMLLRAEQILRGFDVHPEDNNIVPELTTIVSEISVLALKSRYGDLSRSEVARRLPHRERLESLRDDILHTHKTHGISYGASAPYLRTVGRMFKSIQAYKKANWR